MGRSLYFEIYYTLLRAFRNLVPLPQDREPLTWQNAPQRYAFILPLYFLAYLARRKDTYYMRLLILPTALVLVIRGFYAYYDPDPEAYFYNWLRGLSCLIILGKCLDYAFTTAGRFKDGETALPSLQDGTANGTYQPAKGSIFLPPALADAHELVIACRGIGWDFGRGVYVAPEWRPLDRHGFLLASLITGIKSFLVVDFFLSIFRLLPGIGTVQGGSLFYHSLPLIQRYVTSTVIMLFAGVTFQAGFEVINSLLGLFGVGVFQEDPKDYPPVLTNFWAADSVHDFWARRWHQVIRRTFLVFGGIPGQWIAGRSGMVIGTFLASAYFHEVALYTNDRGFDFRTVLFFFLQAVGVILEWGYYRMTGRKVTGILGRVWTYIFIAGFGQMLVDSWMNRGIVGSCIIPFEMSPTRQWLMPYLEPYLRPMLENFLH